LSDLKFRPPNDGGSVVSATESFIFAMPDNQVLVAQLAPRLNSSIGSLQIRRFPDGESYVRIDTPVTGAPVVLAMTLAEPDQKFLQLVFAAKTLREFGASSVGLIAPYLAYMRQDRRFATGEAVTSRQFSALLSETFDWLVTVDPHLHRYRDLSEIYSIPTAVAHAAPDIAKWITANVERPFLVGPDIESRQWVTSVAEYCNAPSSFLRKVRLGDRKVELQSDNLSIPADRTPVILDDILSSGETMLQAVRLLRKHTARSPLCLAVHGLFSELTDASLDAEGARLVCTNTVPNRRSQIDVSSTLAVCARPFLMVRARRP
jgi:ribose-phosphate pyrophosphokinase